MLCKKWPNILKTYVNSMPSTRNMTPNVMLVYIFVGRVFLFSLLTNLSKKCKTKVSTATLNVSLSFIAIFLFVRRSIRHMPTVNETLRYVRVDVSSLYDV